MIEQPSLFVVMLVLGAAFLHALWNAMIKGSKDHVLMFGLVILGNAILGAVLVASFPFPARESWPFLFASTVIHWFYFVFLLLAYRLGDLSAVYPVARGVPPVLVALGGLLFAGEVLPTAGWAGVFLVSGGIGLLMVGRRRQPVNPNAIYAALLTGLTIAAYSVVDGIGVRLSQSVFGFIGWLSLLEGIAAAVFFFICRRRLRSTSPRFYITGIAGGVISALAYGTAIYAASLTNLAMVSALRESGVIMAALIGVIWFGERPWKIRVFAAVVVAAGVAVLATAGG